MSENITEPITPVRIARLRTTAWIVSAMILLLAAAGCITPSAALTPVATPPVVEATATPPVPDAAVTPPATAEAAAAGTWQSTSPDGRWIAEGSMQGPFVEGDQEKYRTRLTVRRSDGQVSWPVIDQVANYGLGYTIPTPFLWSADGQSLYVTNSPVPDGCALFVNGSDLQRVDLATGTISELVPPVGSSLALSPDETRLAYIGWGADTELHVQPLDGGDVISVTLAAGRDAVQAGNITWAPDGQHVLVTVAYAPCLVGKWTQSIVRVDLAPVGQRILVDRDPRLPDTVSWAEPARAQLRDAAGDNWWLDVATGELVRVP